MTKRISDSVAAAKRDYNVNTLVSSSTTEMGRDVDIYAEVSRRTGVNIIASTGSYGQENALSLYWNQETPDQVEWYLMREITEGVGKNKVKCGNITLAWAAHSPTSSEDNWMRAAARVSRQLATPISCHCIYPQTRPQVQAAGAIPVVRPEYPSAPIDADYEYLVPNLRKGGLTEQELDTIIIENPSRLFVW